MWNDWYTNMVFSQVAYPYIKTVSDPVHTGRWFSFSFFFIPHWWVVLFFSSSFFHTGGVIFFFLFFHTGGVILLSMPGIFMWSKDGLPPFAVREMTGVRFQNPFLKKLCDAIQSMGKWVWGEPLDPKLYFFSKDFRHAAMMIKDDKYWNTCNLIF